tara:strand:+ start:2354 stop:3592 length:1239 start_codon:yes stop_codon:yes gene_type:complete
MAATAAANFLGAHTIPDVSVPPSEECPICLDNYTSEQCLRITGIPGCTHRVGQKCLEELLRNRPGDEKKCPLCRTRWIEAFAPASARREEQGTAQRAVRVDAMLRNFFGREYAAQWGGGMLAEPVRQPQPQPPQPHPGQLINLDSDEDDDGYNVQLEHFNNLTRDIESVRTRARDTLVPRGQRRREMREATARQRASSRPGGANIHAGRDPRLVGSMGTPVQGGARREGAGAGANAASGFNRLLSLSNSFRLAENDRGGVPQRSATVGHASNTARSHTERQRHLPHAAADQLPPRLNVEGPSTTPNSSTSTIAAKPPVPDVSQASRPQGQDRHDQREAQLRQTQLRLVQRERDLNVREAQLLEREAVLRAKERQMLAREQRVEQVLGRTRVHRDEMEALVRRQRGEMEKSMQ